MTICDRCHRTLRREPHIVNGKPYGPACARSVPTAPDPCTGDLLDGVDLDGAVLRARERLATELEESAARHLREMRAAWRAAA
jgi:hypothetical protein